MNTSRTPPAINLDQAVYVLSTGLDFVGVDDIQHGKRVACMALLVARGLRLDPPIRQDLFYAALIHDLGVSSTEVHRNLVSELEWDHTQEHCDAAADLIARFRPLAHLAAVLRYHHTHWEVLARTPLPARDALLANLIFLCDRVDALTVQALHAGADPAIHARRVVAERSGTLFRRDLVEAFLEASAAPGFWERLAPQPLEAWFAAEYPPDPLQRIHSEDLRDLARLFAHVVDAKSPFTARHSEGVAQLSCLLAARLGFSSEERQLIEVAGLLHDLGKLRVPDAILEKPAPLDAQEWTVMKKHARDSFELLRRVEGFHQVAVWAGLHHETLRGDGYPEAFRSEELPLPARIITVADVFQALAQDRPYRPGLPPAEILPVLQREVASGHLDREVVALVAADLARCWEAAVGRERAGPGPC